MPRFVLSLLLVSLLSTITISALAEEATEPAVPTPSIENPSQDPTANEASSVTIDTVPEPDFKGTFQCNERRCNVDADCDAICSTLFGLPNGGTCTLHYTCPKKVCMCEYVDPVP